MKRLSLLILCCASMLCAEAQKTPGISVSLGKEPLESILTEEQKDTITHLTITGTPQEQDYKYLRETLISQLTELNMRDADIDTLPPRAFECELPLFKSITIVLPQELKHASDSALCIQADDIKIIMTGKYPTLGKDVYFLGEPSAPIYSIEPSDDNHFLKMTNGNLCSSDGTILYFQKSTGRINEIPKGVRVIYGNAFENRLVLRFDDVIPASVDSIGDRAFANLWYPVITGPGQSFWHYIECHASIPPKLGTDAFLGINTYFVIFFVPDNSVELYKAAEGWKELSIYGMSEFEAQGIQLAAMRNSALSVRHEGESVILSAAKEINRITHYAADGKLIKTERVNANEVCVQAKTLLTPYTIIHVSYKDGTKDNIKLKP